MATVGDHTITLDTSDSDRYLGQPLDGGQLKEPMTVTDMAQGPVEVQLS